MVEVDAWRETILALIESWQTPAAVLATLLAFTLGLLSVRALG